MLVAVRRIPAAEAAVAAALLLLAALVLGPRPLLLGWGWLAAVTPRLVAVDLERHRLPDAIVLPGAPVVLLAVLAQSAADGRDPRPALLAGLGVGLVLLLLHAGGGMGLGDVKLGPLLGALAAAAVPGGAVLLVVAAFAVGGIAAVGVLLRRGTGARMAFGPALLFGAWAVLLLA